MLSNGQIALLLICIAVINILIVGVAGFLYYRYFLNKKPVEIDGNKLNGKAVLEKIQETSLMSPEASEYWGVYGRGVIDKEQIEKFSMDKYMAGIIG
jgi:hypothetical protein